MSINKIYYLFFVIALLLSSVGSQAQNRPFVSGLDRLSATVGEEVNISGLNLPTGANVLVRFGGVAAASITSATDDLIVAEVPAGATYGPITVTDLSTGLTGYSEQHFMISFGGTTFSAGTNLISAQLQFPTAAIDKNVQPFDLTLADLDGDGKLDMAKTNDDDQVIDLYLNTSIAGSPPTFSLNRSELNTPTSVETRNIDSGDLDGDGKIDLVVSRGNNGDRFFIFPNTSTVGALSFGPTQSIILPFVGDNFRIARRPIIADLDGDGKPEIVITNELDNTIHIYQNQSTSGNISFVAEPLSVVATGVTTGVSGLDVKDMNNDGLPDIVVNGFITSADLYAFKNISSPGSISFEAAAVFTAPAGMVNTVIGDFDGDGWNDVASTNVTSGGVLVFRNTSSQPGGAITLADPLTIATNTSVPLGIGLGDLNGDGLLDMAVGHEQTTSPQIVALINSTTGTDISFSNVNIPTASTSRNIKIGDVNDDARPDIVFVNNIVTDALGDLSVFLNFNCITPVIEPNGDQTFCTGAAPTLEATRTKGMTYSWLESAVPEGVTTQSYTVPGTGNYTVTIDDNLNCQLTSPVSANITIDAATAVNPVITNGATSTVCVGTTLDLETSTSATSYSWTGPNGFTSTEQNPTISAISAEQAGTYTLQVVQAAGCISNESTIEITVQNVPEPVVFNAAGNNFCVGNTLNLTTPEYSGFTYSWNNNGTAIAGETTTALTVSTTGSYTAVISDGTCSLESVAQALNAIQVPSSSFNSVDAICENLETDFFATSTGSAGFTLNYAWSFNTETNDTTSFTFTTPGTVSAVLTTAYNEVDNCSSTATRDIAVRAVPTIEIGVQDTTGTTIEVPFEKCPSDPVRLIFSETLTGIQWTLSGSTDTLSTAGTFTTTEAGTYSATGTDDVGCVITSEVDVTDFPDSGLTISSSSNAINDDVIILDDGQNVVQLSVSGGSEYLWTPGEIVSDTTSAMVDVTTFDVETVLTVSGSDVNGCMESATVTISDPFVTPRNTFSPNGDGFGDECWEVANSNNLNGCTVIIFDSRGRRLLEAVSPFQEDCVWDGNFNGSPVPEGVYYYAMSCDDNQFNRSGSILLAR